MEATSAFAAAAGASEPFCRAEPAAHSSRKRASPLRPSEACQEVASPGGKRLCTGQDQLGRCTSLESCLSDATIWASPAGLRSGQHRSPAPDAGSPPSTQAESDVSWADRFLAACESTGGEAPAPVSEAAVPSWLDDLAEANRSIASLPLPGCAEFVPVSPGCCMASLAGAYGIPAIAIALGASYFQRLMMGNRSMQAVAAQHGFFVYSNTRNQWEMRSLPQHYAVISVYAACVYLAVKVADRVPYRGMLSNMLSNLLGRNVPREQAVELERACLKGLDWRMGPYFNGL